MEATTRRAVLSLLLFGPRVDAAQDHALGQPAVLEPGGDRRPHLRDVARDPWVEHLRASPHCSSWSVKREPAPCQPGLMRFQSSFLGIQAAIRRMGWLTWPAAARRARRSDAIWPASVTLRWRAGSVVA